ncbi:hypothetical protein OG883_43900 [Streptomyces sp. NBC_01142]|uniref:hypothetical protein n=1 Tax=Streptomyces sp. NBC_01142 TaxID=2975865 RepID=UPI00224CE719|nr:hypothetical protein [Streptomyces sp. NBC_01142]MCX4826586.1 hypothetical protein [Streptomyces sp. NBC_01142]
MKDEEAPAPALTPAAIRRRFTAAAWGSAIAWPLLTAAAAPLVMWWVGIGLDEMTSADFAAAGLLPLVMVVGYAAADAVRTVRKEQQEVAKSALGLVAAARSGDPSDLGHTARHFGNSLLQARTAFNTRVLPRQATLSFARRVLGEAEAAQLSPASLQAVRELARMEA